MRNTLLAALAVVAFAPAANAAPITGTIGFGGDAAPDNGIDWSTATGINFGNAPNAVVVTRTGSYLAEGVATGQTATFFDFGIAGCNPSGPCTLSPSPVNPLWTFTIGLDTFSFELSSVTRLAAAGNVLSLTGFGTLRISGYDDTPGKWDFTGQETSGDFSFSSTNGPRVPEPGTLMLLGLGLVGVAASRRRAA